MSLIIRPADPDVDNQAIARLLSFVESETVTAEFVRDRQRKILPTTIHQSFLAEDTTGPVVGLVTAQHVAYKREGYFELQIVVDPARRHRGIGAALYDTIVVWARTQGATTLSASVRDDCPACLAFASHRGFEMESHQFEMVLDVAAFNRTPFAGAIQAVQATGIRFFSLAETDSSEAMLRRLYDLNTRTGMDIPGNSDEPVRPFEQFALSVFGGYWFRAEGQIFAADGDRWIGMAAVGEVAPGSMYNMHTGVLRDYRGRGIAQALKLLAIDYARRQGARWIRTNNDSRNTSMLAINQKLGYLPEPGWYRLLSPIPNLQ